MWTFVELGIGCVSANLLTFRPLITRCSHILRTKSRRQEESSHGEVREISDSPDEDRKALPTIAEKTIPKIAFNPSLGVLGSWDSEGGLEP